MLKNYSIVIDDLRESLALLVTQRLKADDLDILAVKPNIETHKEVLDFCGVTN